MDLHVLIGPPCIDPKQRVAGDAAVQYKCTVYLVPANIVVGNLPHCILAHSIAHIVNNVDNAAIRRVCYAYTAYKLARLGAARSVVQRYLARRVSCQYAALQVVGRMMWDAVSNT